MLSIPEFFREKNIFVTGGSGFVGQVLIEKLLRSCPDLACIYVLIRSKKGKDAQERVKELTNCELFEGLKKTNPKVLEKIIAVPGDITELGLGISQNDKQLLQSKLDIIYNCAASVRFDQPLKDAILTNVRSSREVCRLALTCTNLKVLVHVSTAYSNSPIGIVKEKIYPQLIKWQDLIELAENENFHGSLEILSEKVTGRHPNTYVFTKQIAEGVCEELCGANKIPLIILRPSIIIGSLREPLRGWVNISGPFTLIVPHQKAIVTCAFVRVPRNSLDFVFVDNFAKALIISVWLKVVKENYMSVIDGTKRIHSQSNGISIYNACSEMVWPLLYFETVIPLVNWEIPLVDRLWLPAKSPFITNWHYFNFAYTFFNVIPAIFIDVILKSLGRKPIVFKVTKTFYLANICLDYFMTNSYLFAIDNYWDLEDHLLDCDKEAFEYRTCIKGEDILSEGKLQYLGVKRYALGEKHVIDQETHRNTLRLYYLDKCVKILKFALIIYVLFWKFDLISYVYQKIF